MLRGFLSSRETAAQLGAGRGGSMRADGWARMPLVRMTNLHLEPGEGSFEELLADVDDGLYLETNKSWSIDDKRLNFQFGTQIAWEIKKGKLGRMLRDATYTGVTPVFWGSLDAVAGPEEWTLFGLTNCGKGQPGQEAHVSHGAAPARFRDVEVGVSRVSGSLDLAGRGAPRDERRRGRGRRARRAIGRRAVRRLDRPPADADRELGRPRARPARRQDRLGGHEPDRRRRARRGRAPRGRGRRQREARSRLPRLRSGRPTTRSVDGYDEETAALGAGRPGPARGGCDRGGRGHRALRHLHERRDRDRGCVLDGRRRGADDDGRGLSLPGRRQGSVGLGGADGLAGRRRRPGRACARGRREGGADPRRRRARAGHLPGGARAVRRRRSRALVLVRLDGRAGLSRGAELLLRADRRAGLRPEGLDRRRRARLGEPPEGRSTSRARRSSACR